MHVLREIGQRASRASRLGAVAVWAAASSCGAPPSSAKAPAQAHAPDAIVKPTSAEEVQPALSLVGSEPSLEPVVELRDEPLPAFDGRFERVSLPANTKEVVAIAGRGGDDVWMLAKGNAVLHFDGKRTKSRGNPRCYADSCCGRLIDCARNREACSPTCSLGFGRCAEPVVFESLRLTDDDVIAQAVIYTGGLRGALVEARLENGFECEQSQDDLIYPGARGSGDVHRAEKLSVDGAAIRLEGPAWLVNPLGGNSLVIDGRRVALPDAARTHVGLAAPALNDLWLWAPFDGFVWRGNGIAWVPVSTGVDDLTQLWADGAGHVWALSGAEGDEVLLRWDLGRDGWTYIATPGATRALTSRNHTFWLIGKTAQYHWDGQTLSHSEAPLDVADGWLDDAGELWLVGGDRTAKVGRGKDRQAASAVYRVTAAAGRPSP